MAKASGFANGRFDARPDRYDFRDEPYRPPVRSLPEQCPDNELVSRHFPAYAKQKLILDQGNDGACTGFGLACVVNYLLWTKQGAPGGKRGFDRVSAEMLYQLARRYDEWPGEQYEGSSCRGALKGWHKHGVCTETLWPQKAKSPKADWQKDAVKRPLGVYYRIDHKSAVAMQAAIAEVGAIYVSARVHDGWDRVPARRPRGLSHRSLPEIPWPKSARRGGHAFALVGYNERGFVVQNSWGTDWGAFGFAVLPYDDWSEHGDDAWVAALGAPVQLSDERMRALRWPARSGRSLATYVAGAKDPNNPADDPWPIDRVYGYAEYRPWSTATAYEHTLVTGNDGRIEVCDLQHPIGDTAGYARHIAYENPLAWLKKQTSPRLMIYAHGGLNSAAESIDRVRVLAPCFKANGVYPLFLTWKTGPIETLLDMLEDALKPKARVEEAFAAGVIRDAIDRGVEGLGRVLLRGIWTEMRENAARGAMEDHGLAELAENLVRLNKDVPGLGVHLVGHSAGSILLGHLLPLLRDAAGKSAALAKLASCTLYAPACSVRFAAEHYGDALKAAQLSAAALTLYVLSDANEKDDALPSPSVELYGKSLLYFVSRALDDVRKMPLLGFERAARPGYENNEDQWEKSELPVLQDWLKMFKGKVEVVAEQRVRTSSHGDTAQATHGSFDNNVDVITRTIEALTGQAPVQPLEWLNY
jgi:hypothetical protein